MHLALLINEQLLIDGDWQVTSGSSATLLTPGSFHLWNISAEEGPQHSLLLSPRSPASSAVFLFTSTQVECQDCTGWDNTWKWLLPKPKAVSSWLSPSRCFSTTTEQSCRISLHPVLCRPLLAPPSSCCDPVLRIPSYRCSPRTRLSISVMFTEYSPWYRAPLSNPVLLVQNTG